MQVWDIELLWRGSDSLLGEGDKWEGSGMPLPLSFPVSFTGKTGAHKDPRKEGELGVP